MISWTCWHEMASEGSVVKHEVPASLSAQSLFAGNCSLLRVCLFVLKGCTWEWSTVAWRRTEKEIFGAGAWSSQSFNQGKSQSHSCPTPSGERAGTAGTVAVTRHSLLPVLRGVSREGKVWSKTYGEVLLIMEEKGRGIEEWGRKFLPDLGT